MISHISFFPQYPRRNPDCSFVYLPKELPYIIRVIAWKVKGGNLHSGCSARGTEVSVELIQDEEMVIYVVGSIGKH